MKNDQWFQPGDKVMRVAIAPHEGGIDGLPYAPYGVVFCVRDCWRHWRGINVMSLVGVDIPPNWGFATMNFRKVEEIQLCVEAAKKAKSPKEKVSA